MDWFIIVKQTQGTKHVYADSDRPAFVTSRYSLASPKDGALARTINAAMAQSFAFYNTHIPSKGAHVRSLFILLLSMVSNAAVLLATLHWLCLHAVRRVLVHCQYTAAAKIQPSRVYSHSEGIVGISNDGKSGFLMPHTIPYFPDPTGPYTCVQ